ncbi:MAG: hypothetical protein ACP5RE_03440 [Candidatus Acidifodinimicrobium sp.]
MNEIATMDARYFVDTFLSDELTVKRVSVVLISGYMGFSKGKYERSLSLSPDYTGASPLKLSVSNAVMAFSSDGTWFRIFFGKS